MDREETFNLGDWVQIQLAGHVLGFGQVIEFERNSMFASVGNFVRVNTLIMDGYRIRKRLFLKENLIPIVLGEREEYLWIQALISA